MESPDATALYPTTWQRRPSAGSGARSRELADWLIDRALYEPMKVAGVTLAREARRGPPGP